MTAMTVRTVLGPIPAEALGPTLVHEHLLIENPSFVEPSSEPDRTRAHRPVGELAELGWVRRHWTSNADNLVLDDEALAIAELRPFTEAGGQTVVDATVPGIGRDPGALVRIARASGVHVVMGAGAYVGPTHPPSIAALDEAAIAAQLVDEWEGGVDDTGVRPGFIGEIGCSWPLLDRERVVLRGAAIAQGRTGAGLMVHPGRDPRAPEEIVRILADAGADLGRVAMAHLDRTVQDLPGLAVLARTGVFLEFDCFGLESSYYPFDPAMATLSDAQRLDLVRGLLDAGYGEQILLSQDICTKHRLVAFGGHGFAHLFAEVLPWLWRRGVDPSVTTTLVVGNPARFLGVPD
jgi:phosphotriesterase-related protein